MISACMRPNASLSRYFSEIRKFSHRTKDEEISLAKGIRAGSKQCLNELIESNLGFVAKLASEYKTFGVPYEELLNEGNLGLLEAAYRYDHRRGTKFISYASWWVRKAILRALSEQLNLVKVPSYQIKKVKNLKSTEKALKEKLGRKPEKEEISKHLESTIPKIDKILTLSTKEISLDDTVGKDQTLAISELIMDRALCDPEETLIRRERNDVVKDAMDFLTRQEKIVIAYRFGLNGCRIMTLKEIGRMLNISRERVRQIESHAKARLRKACTSSNRVMRSPSKKTFRAHDMHSISIYSQDTEQGHALDP